MRSILWNFCLSWYFDKQNKYQISKHIASIKENTITKVYLISIEHFPKHHHEKAGTACSLLIVLRTVSTYKDDLVCSVRAHWDCYFYPGR